MHKMSLFKSLTAASLAMCAMVGLASAEDPMTGDDLKSPEAFADIRSEKKRSIALFNEMAKVLTHPRCLNCHPVTGGPRQGDEMKPHSPPVVRGAANFGAPGMECITCHGSENVAYASKEGSIPGHQVWFLAPVEMGWIGKSNGEICEQIKDPERNGGKDMDALIEHNAEDGLVGWGWHPGEGREPAPGNQEIFGNLTKAWAETGAHCPKS